VPRTRVGDIVSLPISSTSQERLAALIEISRQLAGEVDLDHLLQLILTTAKSLVAAEGASLLLVEPVTKQLQFKLALGADSEGLKFVRLQPGEGIAGWVVQHGQPTLVANVSQDPRFCSKVDEETGFRTRALMAVPIADHERTVGVIEVLNPVKGNQFTQEDLDLLASLAAQAAVAIRNARLLASIREEKQYLQAEIEERYRTLIGESPRFRDAVAMARRAAGSTATVLLLGETGVGKEMFARSIHAWSPRADHPFVAINCVALTDTLLESELFGHEKGAFTGAYQRKKGLLELANGGTVFLDEIGDMKPDLQAKLLRVLQSHQFERVGGVQPIQADIRVIAATNQDLTAAVRDGRFRKDLYFRLNVITITVPPLRERREDIQPLAAFFVQSYCREMKRPPMTISRDALDLLCRYDWPGNVREMENVIERAVVLGTTGPMIGPQDLSLGTKEAQGALADASMEIPFHRAVLAHKRGLIERAIAQAGGKKAQAAAALQLHPTYFSRLCKQLGIS
jgi:Nif-specific regulatory protein